MRRKHSRHRSERLDAASHFSTPALPSVSVSQHPVHSLQRTIGNRATQHLLAGGEQNSPAIQRFGLWDTLTDVWDSVTETASTVAEHISEASKTSSNTNTTSTTDDSTPSPTPAAEGDIRVVTDKDARIRTPPPEFDNTGASFIQGRQVVVHETYLHDGKTYVRAEEILPENMISAPLMGWTKASNLKGGSGSGGDKGEPKTKVPDILSPEDIPGLPAKPNIEHEAFSNIIHELERMEKNPVKVESKHNEETGDERETRVEDIAKVRVSIAALTAELLGVTEAEVKDAQAYLYRRLAPLAPYYNQIANTNMLEQFELETIKDENGKKKKVPKTDAEGNYIMNPGWMRTCNVTVPAMVVEGIGKTKDDYTGDVALLQRIFKLLEGKYKTRKAYDAVSKFDALRLPDFMTLVAISYQLPEGAAELDDDAFTAALKTARQEAANKTTLHEIMLRLIRNFGAKTDQSQVYKDELEEIGTARRGYLWKQFRNQKITEKDQTKYDSVDADALLAVDTYRDAVRKKVDPILDSGGQVLVGMENHFVRLDAMDGEHVMVDDPGDRDFKNLVVTWEQARDLGFFKTFWKITG